MSWLRALALVALGLAALVWLIPAAPMTGDGQHYIEFVRNGLQHGASSWHERRLLGPLIVRAMPIDAQPGFLVLTLASLAATAVLMWQSTGSLLAIPLLFATWVAAPNVREYGLVDPLAWAFVAGVWLATVRKQWLLAGAIAAIGVVAKEVVVLAAIAAAAAAWQPRRPYVALGVAAPAVLIVGLLTVLFPGSGGDARAYVMKWIQDGLGSLGPARVVFLLFASYGALWLLVPRGFMMLPAHLKRAGLVYLVAAIILPLVGSPERMEEAIFPLFVTSAVLATKDDVKVGWILAIGNMLFVARIGGSADIPTLLAWAGLLVACLLAALTYVAPKLVLRTVASLLR
ncbi:MAG: hypothetical protein JOZ81_18975 [Chloroflexi bacterium]|nr:hypothetical protein [Chloroflexota bacterium]